MRRHSSRRPWRSPDFWVIDSRGRKREGVTGKQFRRIVRELKRSERVRKALRAATVA